MIYSSTPNNFINLLSTSFVGTFVPTCVRSKVITPQSRNLFNLLPVSLTAADMKKFTASDSVRQKGFGETLSKISIGNSRGVGIFVPTRVRSCKINLIVNIVLLLLSALSFNYADAQNVNVSGALSGNGSYASLSVALNAINGGAQNGAVINITIAGNTTETGNGAVLNEGTWNSLSIQPSGIRTVSGAINPGRPLLDLNGADRVTINGSNALTFLNSTVSSNANTSTIRFIADACNNTITGCRIFGSSSTTLGTSTGTILFSTGVTTGNDNNTVSYCDIGPGSGLPGIAVNFLGSPSFYNGFNTIMNCNIYDYFSAASSSAGVIVQSGSTDITIKDNKFYQTGPRTQTTGSPHFAIFINNSSGNNFLVSGNTIGFASASGSGIYSFIGTANSVFEAITINTGISSITNVQGNTIAGISMSGSQSGNFANAPLKCINVPAGQVYIGNVTGNMIGSMSSTGSITYSSSSATAGAVTAISVDGTSNIIVSNNYIGGITASNSSSAPANIWGIRSTTTGPLTCQNNTIGGTIANSIQSTGTSTSVIVNGIENSGRTSTISSNTIRNLTSASGTTAGGYAAPVAGIMVNVLNYSQTISQNIIHSISNTDSSNATVTAGIYLNSTSLTNLVERNFIHSLNANSVSGSITGIYANGGTVDYQNNMIRLGIDGSGNSVPGCIIRGINEANGTNNFYFNSIYIGGSAASGSSNTFAFNSTVTVNTRRYIDNIFFNARSNAGSSGKHYAISAGGTAPLPSGLISDFNILHVTGSGSILGLFNATDQPNLAAWKTATGKDTNSVSSDPQFTNPLGNSSAVNLHVDTLYTTPVESRGISLSSVTIDFDGQARSALTPTDIGADAGNFKEQFAPSISYSLLPDAGLNTVNFNNVIITDASGVNGSPGTRPRCYYKKKTNTNTFNDNTNFTNGWKYIEADGSVSPFNFVIDNSLIFGGAAAGDTIQYFVTAQDLISPPNVGINSGTFASTPSSVNLTASAFPVSGNINYFVIGIVNVTGALTGNGSYTTLASAFSAINSGAQTGANINVFISDNTTEPIPGATLNSGAWTSLIISPAGGAVRTVTAETTTGAALIDLNGADNVRIDGLNTGGNSLIISNTSISPVPGTSTITLRNDASDNMITNCTILGSSKVELANHGGVINIITGLSTGNDNNVISDCNIGPAGNLPIKCISFIGGPDNNNDTVRNCNVHDYFSATLNSAGVYAGGGNSGLSFIGNKFYQTSARTNTPTSSSEIRHSAILIDNSSGNNFTVTGNIIGYSSSNGTGSYSLTGIDRTRFNPIHLKVGSTTASNVNANTIAGISMSGTSGGFDVNAPFIGILISGGLVNIGGDSGNVIGDLTTTGSINFTTNTNLKAEAVAINTVNSSLCTINNNVIGSITSSNTLDGEMSMFGIRNMSSGNSVCQNNIVGGTAANSIQNLSFNATNVIIGIQQTGGSSIVTGNTVRNISAAAGYPNGIFINTGNYNHTVSQNTVYAISNTNVSNTAFVRGIYISSSASNTIERNLVHSLSASGTGITINGIEVQAGTSTIKNNMIRLGLDTSGNSMNTSCIINGMYDAGGTNNYYFNSVYIGGTVSSGSASSYTFNSPVTNNTRNFLNNIFYNARTNNSASVKHYAVRVGGSGINPPRLNCNYNILYAPNTGGMTGFYNAVGYANLSGWNAATGQDINSNAIDPEFINAAGSASSFNLHINNEPTPVEQKGISIGSVTDDFDGETRSSLTPTDIGADAGSFIQNDPLAGDYTVGLSMFNSVTGMNIRFEKTVKKVLKEVEVSSGDANAEINSDNSDNSKVKMMKEVEEEMFVPVQNGQVYSGLLFVKRSNDPDLPAEAMSGVYATITAALSDLYARGANGPVRFLLTDPNYNSENLPITISSWTGSSSVNTLTIKPNAGVIPTISGNNTTAVFDVNNGSNFTLDGSNTNNGSTKDLTIASSSAFASTIRFINDADNNAVKNCRIKGVTRSASNGVVFFSTTDRPSGNDSNLILNNDITGNSISPFFCIYNNGTGTSTATKNSRNRFIDNRCFDFFTRGILDEGNSVSNLYEGNEIYSLTGQSQFQVGCRIVGTSIEGFTFRNNFIHDLRTVSQTLIYGLEVNSLQSGTTGEINNNFISLSEGNSNDMRGIVETSDSTVFLKIYYNTINLFGTVTGTKNSVCYHSFGNSNSEFKNNILVNSRNGGTGKHYAVRTNLPLVTMNSNYNDIYAAGGTGNVFGRIDAADVIDLAAWKSAAGTDSNSISANPLFVSDADLHIDTTQASPVSNAGTPIAGITTDIENNIRSLTTPDIGADEFRFTINSITLDLGMFIEGFYNSVSNLQVSDTVKIYLRNSSAPYSLADSSKAVVSDSGKAVLTFSNAVTGNYYIELTHRNSIRTWSATAVAMTQGNTVNYDFKNSASQAYGANMKQVDNSPVQCSIYSGDVNQDGAIDLFDITDIYNSSVSFTTGYVVTDLDGNNTVDLSDITLAYNNSVNFVSVRNP